MAVLIDADHNREKNYVAQVELNFVNRVIDRE